MRLLRVSRDAQCVLQGVSCGEEARRVGKRGLVTGCCFDAARSGKRNTRIQQHPPGKRPCPRGAARRVSRRQRHSHSSGVDPPVCVCHHMAAVAVAGMGADHRAGWRRRRVALRRRGEPRCDLGPELGGCGGRGRRRQRRWALSWVHRGPCGFALGPRGVEGGAARGAARHARAHAALRSPSLSYQLPAWLGRRPSGRGMPLLAAPSVYLDGPGGRRAALVVVRAALGPDRVTVATCKGRGRREITTKHTARGAGRKEENAAW